MENLLFHFDKGTPAALANKIKQALQGSFHVEKAIYYQRVTTSIYNLILGKLYRDPYGTVRVQGNREYSCKLKFKEQSIIDQNTYQVQVVVQDRGGKTVATVFGKWDGSMHHVHERERVQNHFLIRRCFISGASHQNSQRHVS